MRRRTALRWVCGVVLLAAIGSLPVTSRQGINYAVSTLRIPLFWKAIHFLSRDAHGVSVAEITRLYAFDRNDAAGMRRAVGAKALPESWRSHFRDRIEKGVH